MTQFSLANLFGITLRESANDGSDFTNPDADYRRVFLGEDGQLHAKDSAGTVTAIGGAVTEITDIPTADTTTTKVLSPDGAGGVEWRAEAGGSFPSVSVNRVETDETQSGNNSFADLATSGPAVTVTVNTKVRVTICCRAYTVAVNQPPFASMAFALSSGNTVAASAARALVFSSGGNGGDDSKGASFILTGLTPGSTVFTAKYNQFGASGTTHYMSREISVELLD